MSKRGAPKAEIEHRDSFWTCGCLVEVACCVPLRCTQARCMHPSYVEIQCKRCGQRPDELSEYLSGARALNTTPQQYVIREEGTFNRGTGLFWCTDCYIALGMPLGVAR